MDLQKNIRESTRVGFHYISTQNEQTTREVDPLSLQYKFRTWYLYAYCHLRKDYSEFKFSHILNLERLTISIKDTHLLPKELPTVDPPKERVILRVHPQLIHFVLSHFQHDSMVQEEDGRITMTLILPPPLNKEGLIKHIVNFTISSVVIQPLYL